MRRSSNRRDRLSSSPESSVESTEESAVINSSRRRDANGFWSRRRDPTAWWMERGGEFAGRRGARAGPARAVGPNGHAASGCSRGRSHHRRRPISRDVVAPQACRFVRLANGIAGAWVGTLGKIGNRRHWVGEGECAAGSIWRFGGARRSNSREPRWFRGARKKSLMPRRPPPGIRMEKRQRGLT